MIKYCFILLFFVSEAFAGSANIIINCASKTGQTKLFGHIPGDIAEYNLTVTIGGKAKHYVYECADLECKRMKKTKDSLHVVDKLKKGTFRISFSDHGSFEAIANTIKIKKTANGYLANYEAVYKGIDPRQKQSAYKTHFVKKPILLRCSQKLDSV